MVTAHASCHVTHHGRGQKIVHILETPDPSLSIDEISVEPIV